MVATAKRQLKTGETLDGEGGHCVWGRQMPAADSLALGALPLGLAADVTMRHDIDAGAILTYDDVVIDASDSAVTARRQMESAFNPSHRT